MKTKLSPLFIPFKTIFFSFSNKFCTDNIKKKKKKLKTSKLAKKSTNPRRLCEKLN